jgi:hypothetical protein
LNPATGTPQSLVTAREYMQLSSERLSSCTATVT